MWSIWSSILILIIISISILAIWVKRKYKKLTTKDKKMLEKSLKKMGFFIVLLFCTTQLSSSIEDLPQVDSVNKDYPIVLPSDSLIQASNSITSMITGHELTEEDVWRSNIMLFLDDENLINLTTNNTTNNMTF